MVCCLTPRNIAISDTDCPARKASPDSKKLLLRLLNLLRDFITWEPHGLLRERAVSIVARMEEEVAELILEPKLETV